jgi:hypothetical protein
MAAARKRRLTGKRPPTLPSRPYSRFCQSLLNYITYHRGKF